MLAGKTQELGPAGGDAKQDAGTFAGRGQVLGEGGGDAADAQAEDAGGGCLGLDTVELGGQAIEGVDDVQRLMSQETIGGALPVSVLRGDTLLELDLSPVELVE